MYKVVKLRVLFKVYVKNSKIIYMKWVVYIIVLLINNNKVKLDKR